MIVCLGDLFVDVLIQRHADRGTAITLAAGGSAANTAAWLAWLGAPAGLVAAAGADPPGDMLVEQLRRRGVRDGVARVAGLTTGVMIMEILPERPGPPTVDRRANESLSLDTPQLAMLGEARWLHCTAYAFHGEPSRSTVVEAGRIARAAGTLISLDLGATHLVSHVGLDRYTALIHELAPDLLFANEEEAALLAQPKETLLGALAAFAPTVIVKQGRAGCAVRTGAVESHFPAVPAEVIDPLGAGDAFAAGVIFGLWRHEPMAEAVARGLALGAQCVGLLGGQPPLP
ncbi:MAG TPA: PfkB family carbohydrate kinase [Chloroflexota bacterium]